MVRNRLTTLRLSKEEAEEVDRYLKNNLAFDSISSLGRVAILEFVHAQKSLKLLPNPSSPQNRRPDFLWDYDLTEAQAKEILHHAPRSQRKWLAARILERLSVPAVFDYLDLDEIREILPELRLNPKVKRHWEEAVRLWTRPARKP